MVIAQSKRLDASTRFVSFGLSRSTTAYAYPKMVDSAISELELQQTALFGSIFPGWELIQLLPVTFEQDEDRSYLVSDDEFLVYGTGETLEQARQDYITSLIEYYQILSEHQDPPTCALFRHLQSFLRPIQG